MSVTTATGTSGLTSSVGLEQVDVVVDHVVVVVDVDVVVVDHVVVVEFGLVFEFFVAHRGSERVGRAEPANGG